jgi:hypothetical protein
MNLVVGKEHTAGRDICAVVFDRDRKNKVLFRSYAGFNKRGKSDCEIWRTRYLAWLDEKGWTG